MKTLTILSGIFLFLSILTIMFLPIDIFVRINPYIRYGTPIALLCIFVGFLYHSLNKPEDQLVEASKIAIENTEVSTIVCEEAISEILIERLQEKILKQTEHLKGNQGAFRALIRGMNEVEDIPMLKLIVRLIETNNLRIHHSIGFLAIRERDLKISENEIIYEYLTRKKKDT